MTVDANQLKELHSIELELSQIFEERRSLERHKIECEAAIQELENAPAAYKIIGSIMIAAKPADLLAETKTKNTTIANQLSNLQKREKELTARHVVLMK